MALMDGRKALPRRGAERPTHLQRVGRWEGGGRANQSEQGVSTPGSGAGSLHVFIHLLLTCCSAISRAYFRLKRSFGVLVFALHAGVGGERVLMRPFGLNELEPSKQSHDDDTGLIEVYSRQYNY